MAGSNCAWVKFTFKSGAAVRLSVLRLPLLVVLFWAATKIGLALPSSSTVLVRFLTSTVLPVSVSLSVNLNSKLPLLLFFKLLKSISTVLPLYRTSPGRNSTLLPARENRGVPGLPPSSRVWLGLLEETR